METKPSEEGIVDYSFQREGYCVNRYANEDQYFGYFSNDKRNKQGFYTFKGKNIPKTDQRQNEYYYGNWKNDLKEGYGIYLWIKHQKNKKIFDTFDIANFKSYIGYFNKDKFAKGTYISKENDLYFVYHGTYSSKNKKEGENCFYFSANLEILYCGKFKDDEFIEGFVGKFDDEGKIINLARFEENNYKKFDDADKKITEKLEKFRNIIMSKDYFGIVFDVFKKVVKFRKDNIDGKDTINNSNELVDMTFKFNKITLYKDIEKFMGKEKDDKEDNKE